MVVEGRFNNDSPGMKFGSVLVPVVATQVLTWGVGPLAGFSAFAGAPRMIQVTLEDGVGNVTGVTPYIVGGSISAATFTLGLDPLPGAANTVIHIFALL